MLRVYTKNGRIGNNDRLRTLLAELGVIEWDVILFSEARSTTGTIILEGGIYCILLASAQQHLALLY
eukprot:1997891-Heterocapsa_arctica.AAC.1